ncbi:MAG: hypothetical protein HKN23_02615 [Verrucomicrobiales bacterium]|nr:hypothetical protein [Verrucomicrobiales bacterium]
MPKSSPIHVLWISLATAIAAFFLLPAARAELSSEQEQEATHKWSRAFAWLQTGHTLAEKEQWPLALASYSASLEMFREVRVLWPEFNPEVMDYRIGKLQETLGETQMKLEASDHDLTLQYLDLIEMLEEAEALRFTNEDFPKAYDAIQEAKSLIDQIVAHNPEAIQGALSNQLERIDNHLDFLYEKVVGKTRYVRPGLMVRASKTNMIGTTEFVKPGDLPQGQGSEISSALFP